MPIKQMVSLEQLAEMKNNIASQVVANWVIAGKVKCYELGIKQPLLQLNMPELYQLLIESHWMKEANTVLLADRLKNKE